MWVEPKQIVQFVCKKWFKIPVSMTAELRGWEQVCKGSWIRPSELPYSWEDRGSWRLKASRKHPPVVTLKESDINTSTDWLKEFTQFICTYMTKASWWLWHHPKNSSQPIDEYINYVKPPRLDYGYFLIRGCEMDKVAELRFLRVRLCRSDLLQHRELGYATIGVRLCQSVAKEIAQSESSLIAASKESDSVLHTVSDEVRPRPRCIVVANNTGWFGDLRLWRRRQQQTRGQVGYQVLWRRVKFNFTNHWAFGTSSSHSKAFLTPRRKIIALFCGHP